MNHRAYAFARTLRRALVGVVLTSATGATCASPRLAAADSASRDSARVHVRGIARIDAHATKAAGRLLIAGRVTDDTAIRSGDGTPAAASLPLHLRIAQTEGQRPVTLASTAPESCQGGATRPALGSPDELVLPTDSSGRFCVQVTLLVERYVAHLEVPSSDLVDGASLDLSLDLALRPTTLAFDGAPGLSLDDDTIAIAVRAKEQDPMSGSAGARALPLTLWNESGAAIAETTTDSGGQGLFVVPAARLGPPGRGELRASFAGDANAAPATVSRAVERRTGVALEVPDAIAGRLPEASSDDVEIRVMASAACAARGCKAVPTGTIELRTVGESASMVLGAAPLEHGAARVVVRFDPLASPAAAAQLSLQYVPDAPWFEAPPDRVLVVPIRPRGPWGTAFLVVAGVAVLIWLAVARFPLANRFVGTRELAGPEGPREAAPRVDLVRPGDAGRWIGRVVDAHDATPIAGARVAIERPAFRDVRVLVEGASDAAGAFALRSDATIAGDDLVVESRVHAVVRRPLPAPGEIEVALVQRRRVLIDQLVAWAKRRGRPFDARPEPTPAHVRRAAARLEFALEQRTHAARIEQWADAVEVAVYGGAPVDARAQGEVERLGPGDGSKPGDAAHADPDASEDALAPRPR